VRRAGNTVRITAQLINTVSGFHLWSQTYDRKLTDILKIQTDVATSVARQLEVELGADEAAKLELDETKIPEAYDAFLRGMQLLANATSESAFRMSLAAFDDAIAFDSRYAIAYAKRAVALTNILVHGTGKAGDRRALREDARKAAERAVALAPDLAEAHTALFALRELAFRDFAGAAPEIERAIALAPGDARSQQSLGIFEDILGHHDAAIAAHRRAVRLDPQNYRYRENLAVDLHNARRFSEALIAMEDAKALNPASQRVAAHYADCHLALGHTELAQRTCESPSMPMAEDDRHQCLALVYHVLGRTKEAASELEKLKALDGDAGAFSYAEVYAQWSDTVASLQWLAAAERLYDHTILWIRSDWLLDAIRNEPQL
jgi:serine/threonine-protein kinase